MKQILIAIALLASVQVFAKDECPRGKVCGAEGKGGGDPCERRIQEIRDDISSWISQNGPDLNRLEFKDGLSLKNYTENMSEALKVTSDGKGNSHANTLIECVHHTIEVQGEEKVCRFDKNDRDTNSPKITCYYEAFLDKKTMDVDEQYRLIHHEYAGLADLEKPDGAKSQYPLSNQITKSLGYEYVKRLVIRPKIVNVGSSKGSIYEQFCKPVANEQLAEAEAANRTEIITETTKTLVGLYKKQGIQISNSDVQLTSYEKVLESTTVQSGDIIYGNIYAEFHVNAGSKSLDASFSPVVILERRASTIKESDFRGEPTRSGYSCHVSSYLAPFTYSYYKAYFETGMYYGQIADNDGRIRQILYNRKNNYMLSDGLVDSFRTQWHVFDGYKDVLNESGR